MNQGISVVIPAYNEAVCLPKTLEAILEALAYLRENVGAADVQLSAGDMARLDEIAPKDVAAGERYPSMATIDR